MVYVIYFQDLDAKYVNCQQNFDRANSYQYAALCADEPQHVWTALTSQITSFFSVWNAKFRAEKYGQTLVQMITHTYSPSSLTEEFFFYKKNENSSCHFISQFNAISFIKKKKIRASWYLTIIGSIFFTKDMISYILCRYSLFMNDLTMIFHFNKILLEL